MLRKARASEESWHKAAVGFGLDSQATPRPPCPQLGTPGFFSPSSLNQTTLRANGYLKLFLPQFCANLSYQKCLGCPED